MNFNIKILIFFLVFSVVLEAKNFLYNNSSSIVDVGRVGVSNEVEVPKENIYTEPVFKAVSNKIIYSERVQSPLIDCERDIIGVEHCKKGEQQCKATEEYSDGYSVKHTTIKTFKKICQPYALRSGNKCFLDENLDGIKDNKKKRWHTIEKLPTRKTPHGSDMYWCARNGTLVDTLKQSYMMGYDDVKKVVECVEDKVIAQNYTVGHMYHNASVLEAECIASLGYKKKWQGKAKSCTYDFDGTAYCSSTVYDYFAGDGHALSDIFRGGCATTKDIYHEETICPNNNWLVDGDNCYKRSECPPNTKPQADGSCKMEYDWYEYKCFSDKNIYNRSWAIINRGGDCGNPTCTNSRDNHHNNCVRRYDICPFDSSVTCGKTRSNKANCGNAYLFDGARCKRKEPYCGSSTYNSLLDRCEDVTLYTKLCTNPNEIYNPKTNKCETGLKACPNGAYDKLKNLCVDDFLANCSMSGYTYNRSSGICENASKPICGIHYSYKSSLSVCVGSMTMCSTGFSYNETTNKCEKNLCGILNTSNSNSRCETSSQCDGTLTASGRCIPSAVQR